MKLSFDKFERYELPQVTLCNPNSRATEVDGQITITDTVGVLSNPKGMNLKLNFNAPHELSFDYYRHKSTDPIKQSFYDSIYEAVQTDRYIYLTDIGYFIISNVADSDENNMDKLSITCKSCEENELAISEGLYLKEGTYYLHTKDNQGLLDLFLPKTAGWTMGHVDSSRLTKPYYVEETDVDNGYDFLYTTIQDMFECIVEPDIIKRTISVYSRTYYAEHHLTDIHIAKYNLLKHKTIEENDEDKYTALNVQGKDENLEIRAVNPTGKNVIYNFEPRYSWMSPALQQAVEKWQEKCESVEDEYLTLQQGYYTELEKLCNEEQDIEVLKGELKTLEETRDAVIITAGDLQSTALNNVNAQMTAKQNEINTATSSYNSHKETVRTTYEVPINQINADCALDVTAVDINGNTIFTADLLNELTTHIKPTDYVDEYMLVTESMTYPQRFEKAKELMDRAQSQLVKISSGQKTYSIDTRSFFFSKQFKHFSEQLCAGAIIYVETKNDIMEQLHLTGIDISFDEKSTKFTLGNKYDRSDLKALYDDALGQNSKSFSELKYIASIIEDQQKQLDYQKNWVADLRTLTLDNVLTSADQAFEINNRGLIGRKRRLDENGEWDFDENGNPLFELEQVKLINNNLVFTENNWKTAATAVGKIAVGYNSDGSVKYMYGINGQVLIGELILGNNLVLTGTGAGIKIKDRNGNDAFYADEDGNLVLSGKINAQIGNIAGWSIEPSQITKVVNLGTNNLRRVSLCSDVNSPAFFVTASDTTNSLFRVNWDGSMKATSGSLGGWTFTQNNFYKTIGEYSIAFGLTGIGGTSRVFKIGKFTDITGTWGAQDEGCSINGQGQLRATGAIISGNITASTGKVGGWIIDDGSLYYQNGNSGCGLYGHPNHANIAIHAGANQSNIGGAPFRVYHDGSLYATSATIKGTLQVGSKIFDSDSLTLFQDTSGNGFRHEVNGHSHQISFSAAKLNLESQYSSYKAYLTLHPHTNSLSPGDAGWQPSLILGVSGTGQRGLLAGEWYIGSLSSPTAVTSDVNLKNSINLIDEKYETFFDSIEPVTYKYNDSEADRIHTGYIAQQIDKALTQSGLTKQDFAGLVITNYNLTENEPQKWALRYEEFVSLNTWQIQKLKSKVTNLENTVVELKTQIQTLTAG